MESRSRTSALGPRASGLGPQASGLKAIFGPGGILARRLPSYEYRPSQLRMAQAVLDAIQRHQHLCVEAGTGTGKSLAYLIPALFARKRVIVSTATKNLQEQLFFKDVPFIRQHVFPDLAVTCMKGRQNYLCLKKFREQTGQEALFGQTEPWQQVLSSWTQETETGDRAELSWISDHDTWWKDMDARSESCMGQKCSHFGECYITRMRQRALESDIIVVNHALFFANLALESDEIGRILPDYSILILDEAHEVEDIAANHLTTQVSNYQVEEFCRDFLKVLGSVEGKERIGALQESAALLFMAFPGGEGRYSLNFYRRPNGLATDLRLEMEESFLRFQSSLEALQHHMERQSELPEEADALVRRLRQLGASLDSIFRRDDPDDVYWFEKRGRGVFLHVTPIDIAPILKERLFDRTDTAILTSATLATQGNFDYVKQRLGIMEPRQTIVAGEFDYSRQAILYIPRAFPEPRAPQYLIRFLREVRQILEMTEGQAFLLFTSFQQMDRVYEALKDSLPYPLLCQGEMPKTQLLEKFKETECAVLCATASFWQGVDVQGDALRAVIIDKLPFLVPTEPVVAARLHRLNSTGRNSFLEYSIPEAIITLKQGLGRLIRSRQDRGILAVMDSRLRTRSYGRLFLESLPNCPVTDNMGDLKNFFNQNES
ncbi:MAG: ATP-dependent DNA helicase [Acidobacteriota bacterium]